MLTRYRWYRVRLPSKGPSIVDIISNHHLSESSNFGFALAEDLYGIKKIRFIWKTNVVVTKLDNGTPIYEEIASINFTDFCVINIESDTFLRIENPGRNIRELLNALESLFGLGFTSKAIGFDKEKPISVFKEIETARIVGLKIVGAAVDKDLVARMEFASKQGIIVENIKTLQNINYKIDFINYEMIHQGVRGQLAFTSGGLVKAGGQLAPLLVKLIEKDLPILT